MINSKQFYQYLQAAFIEARNQIEESGAGEVNIFIFSMKSYTEGKAPDLEIHIDGSRGDGKKVVGRDLRDCVEEYIRRSGFVLRQQMAQLEAPKEREEEIIQSPPEAQADPMAEDEIPF